MKKYITNKSKLILTALTIPMVVSVLPIDNVFAAENQIPTLNVYVDNTGTPKLEWATEILKENILNKSSFEIGDEMATILYNGKNGQQEFTTETAYDGITSLKINKTTGNLGNYYSYPSTSGIKSRVAFPNRKYIENGTNLSVSLKVKTNTKAIIEAVGNGGPADKQLTFQEQYKSSVPFKFAQNAKAGQKYFYVTNPKEFKKIIGTSIKYTVNKKSTTGSYNYLEILDIDETTGKVTLKSAFAEDFNIGDDVLSHRHFTPVSFSSRTITNTNGEWVTINMNTMIKDTGDYNTLLRGFEFWINTTSDGGTYIDDVEFGYATQVEVFREGTSVYKGYLSDFQDTKMKDVLKPNKVNKINTTISDDFKVNFTPVKPLDQSKKVSYTIQSIAQNGSRSAMSTPQTIETATGVQKYKYSVTKSAALPKSLTNTTTGLDFNIPLNTLNLEEDYIHVQAIDGSGNLSDIQTFKVSEIVDISFIQSLYDDLKNVEDSSNYNDFLTFMAEVESMYGTNMPQDMKNRIQQLATYHGENTSFLQLLEGEFTLQTSDITSFGKVKLTATKQTITTSFIKDFKVIDARGTQEGWKVNVSATPFVEDMFEGFIGLPTQLPLGTLALNNVESVNQIGIVQNSQYPNIKTSEFSIIDSGEVTLLQANKGQGMGEFDFNFNGSALSMVVDATTARIDNKNYPEGVTPYTSTITWNLITGP